MIKKARINQSLMRIILLIFSLSLVFISGSLSTDVKIEGISFYSSQVVTNNTVSRKHLSLTIKSNGSSGSLPQWESEFHSLYGSFRERIITFASTINAQKGIDLKLSDDKSIVSGCLSMLYFGPTGTIPYPVQNPTHYKHYVLPIELMFKDDKTSYDINRYIINISQAQANALLANKGLEPQPDGNYLKEQYKTLIKTECFLIKDGNSDQKESVCINNIYLQENYYYEGLNETIRDFVMVSYFLPWNLRSEQENTYFLTNSSYQNSYFMKHINAVYGIDKYDISVNKNNVTGYIDEKKIVSFNTEVVSSTNWASVLLLVLSILFIAGICLSNIWLNGYKTHNIVFEILSLLIPYFVFFVIFKITNNLLMFSSFSCLSYFFITASYLFLTLLIGFIRKNKIRKLTKSGGSMHEIHI